MKELVEIKNNQIVTSSRQVAKSFNKQHKDVLKSVRAILVAQNCATKFFQESHWVYRGQKFPEFYMNRDGFSLLVMGFTGQKALQWKIKYIEAFNAMEQKLKHPQCEKRFISSPYLSTSLLSTIAKRIFWHGHPMINNVALMNLTGIPNSSLLSKAKQLNLRYDLLSGADIVCFKQENKISDYCASRIILYTEDTVRTLLRSFRIYNDYRRVIDGYFANRQPFLQMYQCACQKLKFQRLPL